jgi:hypothetical protein
LRANQGSKRQQDCAFLAPFDITTDDQRNNKNEAENRTKNNQSANSNNIPFKTILIKNNITTKQNKQQTDSTMDVEDSKETAAPAAATTSSVTVQLVSQMRM